MGNDDNYFETTKKLKNRISSFQSYLQGDVKKEGVHVLKNITKRWIEFLKKDKYMKKNSFIKLNIAIRGGGKTATVFSETNILLRNNPKRIVQFWKTDAIIDKIEKYCPEKLIGRYESINNLNEIKQNSIFVIDEGLIGANAKEALKIEMRNFIKFFSKSRHYNIIGIINSVSLDILLQFRNMIDIVAYRRLPRFFLLNNNNKDYILKEYGDELTKLKEWQSVLISSYKRFQVEGLVSMKYEHFCPWFNDDISMYQQNTSADVEFDENKTQLENNTEIAKWLIDEIGDRFFGTGGFDDFSMWLYTNYNEDYHNNRAQLKIIHKLYKFYIKERSLDSENDEYDYEDYEYDEEDVVKVINKKEDEYKKPDIVEIFDSIKEVDKFFWKYDMNEVIDLIKKEETKLKKIDRDYDMYQLRESGMLLDDIALKYGLVYGSVSSVTYRMKGLISYYKGKLFEKKYYSYLTKLKEKKIFDVVELFGNPKEPDIMAINYVEDVLFIFSLKAYDMDTRPFTIETKDFMIECETAYKAKFKHKKVVLYLIVYDTFDDNIYEYNIDFINPKKIRIE